MTTTASSNLGLTLMQCLRAVVKVILASLLTSLALTPILGLINTLRNYGLPPDVASVAQAPLYAHETMNSLAAVLDWYNSSMSGYARFGSGLGLIAGAFWAMGGAKGYVAPARVWAGLTAGTIIGARSVMMITSDVPIVLGGAAIGAVFTGSYLFIAGLPSRFKPLPRLNLCSHD